MDALNYHHLLYFWLVVKEGGSAAVDDSFADGRGASAAGDFDHSTPTRQVFSAQQQASGPAALLAPIQKVSLFFLSAVSHDLRKTDPYS